jgi:ribonuclease I
LQRRKKLEQEYAAHRRRLAEDWKRLEQQEQETLANLQSKEKDLKKRRELLEWEIDQEMEQVRKNPFHDMFLSVSWNDEICGFRVL